MKHTTVCYIKNDKDEYLLLHRVKKENDENKDKWIGIGGKFKEAESPFDCVRREILEETGITPINLRYRAVITFVSEVYGTEYMHLFSADGYDGELKSDCEEGDLRWVPIMDVLGLPLWEGDKIFLRLLGTEERFFSLKLIYDKDGHLQSDVLEFAEKKGC